jgi:UDP-N-acetylglucosamine 3-dehydrogenase
LSAEESFNCTIFFINCSKLTKQSIKQSNTEGEISMLRVLVIGAGTMGTVHARAYSQMEQVQLVGIADIQEERACSLAKQLHTQAFDSFEEAMNELESVDVVDICLPTDLHKEYVMKAAGQGKHVICEKPLTNHLQDAREMIEFCKAKGVQLFVGHVLRFFPEYKRAKELVQAGKIGKPKIIRTRRGGIFPYGWNDWYADFKKSGGLILDMIIHDFDYLRWCFGDVERVYAKSLAGREFAKLDYALVTLRFQSGVIAHVEGTWAHEGFSMGFEIAGTSGIIEYDSAKDQSLITQSRQKTSSFEGVAVPESPLKEDPYFLELQHFIHCLETGGDPIVSAEDAYKAAEIALAALQSAQTGQAITLGREEAR